MNDEDEALIHKITDLLKYLNKSSGRMGDNARFHGVDLRRLSFIVPGAEGFTMEERQRFLEMTSARERIEKGLRVLEKVIARVKSNQKVWEIIDGNGHVKAFWAVDFLWLGLIAKRFYQPGFH